MTGPSARATAVAVLQTTMAMLGPFLLGALTTSMRADIGLSPADLGLAASGFFGMSAVVSAFANRHIERLGVAAALVMLARHRLADDLADPVPATPSPPGPRPPSS